MFKFVITWSDQKSEVQRKVLTATDPETALAFVEGLHAGGYHSAEVVGIYRADGSGRATRVLSNERHAPMCTAAHDPRKSPCSR